MSSLEIVFKEAQRRTFLKSWVWVLFLIFMFFKKGPFRRTFCSSKRQKPSTLKYGERPCRDLVFHETTVILVPLRPNVFKNIIFSMMISYAEVCETITCNMKVRYASGIFNTPRDARTFKNPSGERLSYLSLEFKRHTKSYLS